MSSDILFLCDNYNTSSCNPDNNVNPELCINREYKKKWLNSSKNEQLLNTRIQYNKLWYDNVNVGILIIGIAYVINMYR
jgi:hypothetical protein